MSLGPVGRRHIIGVRVGRSLFAAAAAIVLALGAGGAQAAGGALDPSFGVGGKVLTDLGGHSLDWALAVAIQGNGKIVAAGSSRAKGSEDFAVVRYTTTGALDASFGRKGRVLTSLRARSEDVAEAVTVQADGKIVAAGSSYTSGGEDDFALVRYTSSGVLDTSFGKGGRVLTSFSAKGNEWASAVAIQRDGKIVAAGVWDAPGRSDFALVRYTTGGQLDATFGKGGKVLTDIRGDDDGATAVAVQKDGKIVATGWSAGDFALVRYTPDGKLDMSFGSGGKVVTSFGTKGADAASGVAVQPDGKIVAAGSSWAKGSGDLALVRYTAKGKLDAGFANGGKVLTDLRGSSWDEAVGVTIQTDAKIVVAGFSIASENSNDFALVRYTKNGKLDPSFGSGGKVLTDLDSYPGGHDAPQGAEAIALQPDGKIIVAGTGNATKGSGDFALVRYMP